MKVRTYASNALLQSYAIQPAPPDKPCISLRVFIFLSCQISLAEYIRVLRVLSHPVAVVGLVLLKVVAMCRWARWLCFYFSSTCFCWRMSFKLAVYFNLCYYNYFKAMLFLLIRFELSIYSLFMNLIIILFPLQTPCMWCVFA